MLISTVLLLAALLNGKYCLGVVLAEVKHGRRTLPSLYAPARGPLMSGNKYRTTYLRLEELNCSRDLDSSYNVKAPANS